MLQIIVQMEKMATLCQIFADHGMLFGTTSLYRVGVRAPADPSNTNTDVDSEDDSGGPEPGDPTHGALSIVKLALKPHANHLISHYGYTEKFLQ